MNDEPYVIWSNQHNLWWAPRECGYRVQLLFAGVYSRVRAERIAELSQGEEVAVPLDAAIAKHLGAFPSLEGTVLERLRAMESEAACREAV